MAGDWIKMRIDLQSHPKVVRILSATKSDKFRVIGGLHAVWSVFDTHSDDGVLIGYTPETLDHIIGWSGFSTAMTDVGWLIENIGVSLAIPEFSEHNGQSGKRRAEDQKRKRDSRNGPKVVRILSANEPDKKLTREEKRREESNTGDSSDMLAQSEQPLTDFAIPLVDSTAYRVPVKEFEIWTLAYPAVDIGQEILKMVAWVTANPTKRKTRRGVAAFAVRWLSKAQDQPSGRSPPTVSGIIPGAI